MEHKGTISFILESPSKNKKLGLYNKYYNSYSNENYMNNSLIDNECININSEKTNFEVGSIKKLNGFDVIESWLDKSMEKIIENKEPNKTIWSELLESRLKFKGGMIKIKIIDMYLSSLIIIINNR